mgnify:CR=1 FL=1
MPAFADVIRLGYYHIMPQSYTIVAIWDPEARVFTSQSDIPGLVVEADTFEEFVDLVRFLSELGKEGDYKIKPNRFIRSWRFMGPMEQVDVDHVRHTGLQALNDRTHTYPWQLGYSMVNGSVPLAEITTPVKMYPWFPKMFQCDLQMDAAGKVKLKLSISKNVIVAVGDKVLQEVTDDLTLDLPAGKTVVSFIITRDAGDLKTFSAEIIDGAAKVVTSP